MTMVDMLMTTRMTMRNDDEGKTDTDKQMISCNEETEEEEMGEQACHQIKEEKITVRLRCKSHYLAPRG